MLDIMENKQHFMRSDVYSDIESTRISGCSGFTISGMSRRTLMLIISGTRNSMKPIREKKSSL